MTHITTNYDVTVSDIYDQHPWLKLHQVVNVRAYVNSITPKGDDLVEGIISITLYYYAVDLIGFQEQHIILYVNHKIGLFTSHLEQQYYKIDNVSIQQKLRRPIKRRERLWHLESTPNIQLSKIHSLSG